MNHENAVLVIADLEGIYDVYDLKNIDQYRESYNNEVISYIDALVKNGVINIDICDVHDQGNLLLQIPQRYSKANIRIISTISGINFETKYVFSMMVGFHGMAGSLGVLPHSFRHNFKQISICCDESRYNIPIGEVEVYSRWLGSKGIPVILVAGDREAVYEGNCFNPYRETCCVKSCFENNKISCNLLFDKIQNSVYCAMKLDYGKCISTDNCPICISFTHEDQIDEFSRLGYRCKDKNIIFDSCSEFVSKLYDMVDIMIEFDKNTFTANLSLLKELRKLAPLTSRDTLINSEIGELLAGCNLFSLNRRARNKIRAYFENIIADMQQH